MTIARYLLLSLLAMLVTAPAKADESTIDKVYHPYVTAMEKELEYRLTTAEGDYKHRLGAGKSFSDRFFAEAYLIGTEQDDNFRLDGYELESRIQLTEQGEYAIDWGMLLELEKSHELEEWETAATALMEKQWGRWVGTANLTLEYEWGDRIDNEFETAAALQGRYRLSAHFEPAVELYAGENTRAIGPVAMGDIRFAPGKKLHWESGVLFGFGKQSPDATLRLSAEYEF
jgi:hypothetical protein